MIEREFRPSDVDRMVELSVALFPEENTLYGIRAAEVERIVRRFGRPHVRLLLGLLRAVGRAPFRFRVLEEDGRVVATTVLTFGPKSGYVSFVMVDPATRRRGYARRLLESSRELTRRRGKPYIVLDVLAANAPARTLYDTLGYRQLRSVTLLRRAVPSVGPGSFTSASAVREYDARDGARLQAIAARGVPPEVSAVLPVGSSEFGGGTWSSRLFSSASASWVVDAGYGAEAFVGASVSPVTEAAHLIPPIVSDTAEPARVGALLRAALDWVAGHGASRVVVAAPAENVAGRRALLEAGFEEALELVTLYRTAA